MCELTWLIDISLKQQGWSVNDLRVALPLCPDFCVWSIYGFIDLDHTVSLGPHACLLPGHVSLCFLCPPWYYLDFLQSSCSCRARQVAWSLGGWILRHLRGCFVLILFKEPTFLVGTGSVSLLLLCDMIQRLYLFLSSLWYSQRQRQSEAVLLARSLAVQRGTAVSEKDSCVLSSHWCHLGQCALVGCIDLCFLDVSGVGSAPLQLVFSR